MEIRKHTPPTPFQRRALWGGITALSILSIGVVAVFVVWVVTQVLAFLQPVLVPLAAAGIIAFLLEPLINRLMRRGLKHMPAMLIVYVGFIVCVGGIMALVIPLAVRQSSELASRSDELLINARVRAEEAFKWIDLQVARFLPASTQPAETPASSRDQALEWLDSHRGEIIGKIREFVLKGFSGFLGVFGYLIGFFLVPVYLYYFLKESESISRTWSHYLPLRQSKFRSEVVSTLTEINGYLIAFFRGQMLVGIIDGVLVGLCLYLLGLPYGLLIGLVMAMLGLIPYVGPLICWIPAVLISLAHFSQPENQMAVLPHLWAYPLIVTGIFIVVQKIDSFFLAPRIVGDAVGLHPLTVIFSVLFWSFLVGGFLGALLAVPLTASIKVLFRRYIWQRRLQREARDAEKAEAVP
ncbi:MAG: AI-2E family transporter [Verrucomicrobiales bacterium]